MRFFVLSFFVLYFSVSSVLGFFCSSVFRFFVSLFYVSLFLFGSSPWNFLDDPWNFWTIHRILDDQWNLEGRTENEGLGFRMRGVSRGFLAFIRQLEIHGIFLDDP